MADVFPSLIAADLMNLRGEIETLDPHCNGYHIDVMDGQFVSTITWGPLFISAIGRTTTNPLLVHLMVADPTDWIKTLTLPPNSSISFHIESGGNIIRNLERIREKRLKPIIAINPKTPIETIFPYLDIIDSILLMSVEPGFSGQTFLPEVMEKIKPLLGSRQTNGTTFSIGMDGGINKENIRDLAQHGVDWFAVGSAIFAQPNQVKALEELKKLAG